MMRPSVLLKTTSSGLPLQAEAILIIEIDQHPLAIEEEINKCADICRAEGASYVKIAE